GEKSRLAGIGQADQTSIGNQFEPQPDPLLLAGQAGIGTARRLVGRRLEMQVAEAAVAALEEQHALADFGQVGDQRLVVLLQHLRANRNAQHDIGTLGAIALLAHAMATGLCLEMLAVTIVDQRVEAIDTFYPDVATATAVAAVRSTELDELLAAERNRSGTAVAGADIDLRLIEELHLRLSLLRP